MYTQQCKNNSITGCTLKELSELYQDTLLLLLTVLTSDVFMSQMINKELPVLP